MLMLIPCHAAFAATYYWNTTGSGNWVDGAKWSNNANSGGTTGVVPGAADTAVFNQSSVNGSTTSILTAATAIYGITFNNTGTTLIDTNGSARTLTLGAGGLTINSGAGAVTFGHGTATAGRVNFSLGTSQTWTNNSANELTFFANEPLNLVGNTITFAGSGGFKIDSGGINDGSSPGGSVIIAMSGSGYVNGSAFSTFTGPLILNSGTYGASGDWGPGGTDSSLGKGTAAASNIVFGGGTLSHDIPQTSATGRLFTIGNANGLTATIDSSSTAAADTVTFSGTGAIAFGGSGARSLTLTGSNTGANTLAPVIGDGPGGATALVKSGSGKWVLSGANTYTGNTTVNGGILVLKQPTLAAGSTVVVNSGGKLQLDFPGGATNTVGTLVLNGVSQPVGTYNASNNSTYFAGAGSLQVTGSGGSDFYNVAGGSVDNVFPVLTNDVGNGLTLVAVTTPVHGSASISGSTILYTPTAGFSGNDSFSYTNQNGGGATSTWIVTVTVSPYSDQYQVLRDSATNPLDVLRNDTGNGLVLDSVTPPTHGSALVSGTNVIYTPTADYVGTDGFTYTTHDDQGAVATRTVSVDVRQYPNFVFIFADDQGWTGLSVPMDKNRSNSKSDYYRTPNMEVMAAQAMRFSFGYSPAPNCSPSRCAVLTGRTPARLKFTDIVGRNNNATAGTTSNPQYRLITPGKATDAIPSTTTSIPELLKSIPGAGYSAAHFGKWHLGGGGPVNHGFDADANDGATDNGDGDIGATINPDPKQAYGITDRAFAFLTSRVSAGAPFYLQTSHYAVHEEIQTTQSSYDSFAGVTPGFYHNNRLYAGMTTDLDINVGRLMNKLDDLGLRNSTYIIYHSDNGAPQAQSENYPLRGYKPEVWEGGTRVPTFVRGPGVPANSQCDTPVEGTDILPTIWEWATGSSTGLPSGLDGGSLVPTILSIAQDFPSPSNVLRGGELVHHAPHYVGPLPWPNDWQQTAKDGRPRSSIHVGHYKLVANYEPGTIELYDLDNDIGEQSDLSPAQLAIKWQLWVRLRDYLKLIGAQMPTLDPTYPGTNQGSFVLPAATGPLGDADSDGLPDNWEFRELLTTQYSGSDDPSHSGMTLAQMYAQGLDPLVPGAHRIDSITQVSPNQIKLTWNATPGSSFVVQTSTDLVHWTQAQTVTSGDVFYGEVTVITTGDRGFFRVRKR
jgi:autotransporter-associated beta strand protein